MTTKITIGAIVVDTHDTDEYRACVDACEDQCDDVATIINSSIGLSEARNQAVKTLDTDVYAFIDSDATPCENWVDELRTGYENGEIAVGGPATPTMVGVTPITVPPEWEWLVGIGPFHDDIIHIRNTYGCNFSVRADVFDNLGGFDEQLGKGAPIPHGEETEFAQRMYRVYGQRMQYRPKACVKHRVGPTEATVTSLLKRAYNQGYTKACLGVESEETGFVKRQVKTLSPWKTVLLGSLGFGYVVGKIRGENV